MNKQHDIDEAVRKVASRLIGLELIAILEHVISLDPEEGEILSYYVDFEYLNYESQMIERVEKRRG